jgi:hypothetical protein
MHKTLTKSHIKRVYDKIISVSALTYFILQHRANHLDPEQALLAGLVPSMNIIPILN